MYRHQAITGGVLLILVAVGIGAILAVRTKKPDAGIGPIDRFTPPVVAVNLAAFGGNSYSLALRDANGIEFSLDCSGTRLCISDVTAEGPSRQLAADMPITARIAAALDTFVKSRATPAQIRVFDQYGLNNAATMNPRDSTLFGAIWFMNKMKLLQESQPTNVSAAASVLSSQR